MSRIRTIKPDFFKSPSLARCSLAARLTFQGLWCEADDEGLGRGDPRILKGAIWPLDDNVTATNVAEYLTELENTSHIQLYEARGDVFYSILRWEHHQSAAYRRGASKYPPPPADTSPSHLFARFCTTSSAGREGKGREGNREGRKHASARSTQIPEDFEVTGAMQKWAAEKGMTIDLDAETEQFKDHWRAKGESRKDWVASWRTWMRNAEKWSNSSKKKILPIAAPRGADPVSHDDDDEGEQWILPRPFDA